MWPGGLIYDGGFSYWAGGCSERPPKRQRFTEPNYYFGAIGIPAQGFAEVCNMPPIASGSNRARFFGPNPYVVTGTMFSHSSRANSIQRGESTASLHDFLGVRIRGLPFNCRERHIYRFFTGLDVVDCLFINKNWRFTGEAYVVFSNPMQVQLALQRVRQNVGHRYIELFACKKRDCYNVVAAKVSIFFIFGCIIMSLFISLDR